MWCTLQLINLVAESLLKFSMYFVVYRYFLFETTRGVVGCFGAINSRVENGPHSDPAVSNCLVQLVDARQSNPHLVNHQLS